MRACWFLLVLAACSPPAHGDTRRAWSASFGTTRMFSLDGSIFVSSPTRTYEMQLVDPRTGVIDRGSYRIELALEHGLPTSGHVRFANGDVIAIEWSDGRITSLRDGANLARHRGALPPHVDDERFAAAILVARDLAWKTVADTRPPIDVRVLGTEPELVLVTRGWTHYLDRVGLVRGASPDVDGYACIVGNATCELAIEGPDGQGLATFDRMRLVVRPQVVHAPRRAWQELVPGRIARMRGDLIECERALADAERELAKPLGAVPASGTGASASDGDLAIVREAVSLAISHLRDARDAVDDILTAQPASRASAIHFEVLRDQVRDELVKLELATAAVANAEPSEWAALRELVALPDIAALRVALSKLSP